MRSVRRAAGSRGAPQWAQGRVLGFFFGATSRRLLKEAAQERPQNFLLRVSANFSPGRAKIGAWQFWQWLGDALYWARDARPRTFVPRFWLTGGAGL